MTPRTTLLVRALLGALLVLISLVLPNGPAWASCGDHVLEPGESCDGYVPGPSCDASCRVEGIQLGWMHPTYGYFIGDMPGFRGRNLTTVGPAVAAVGYLETGYYTLSVFGAESGAPVFGQFDNLTGPVAALGTRLLLAHQTIVPATIRVIDLTTGLTDATLLDPTPGDYGFAQTLLGLGDAVLARDSTNGSVVIFEATGPVRHVLSAPPPEDPAGFGHNMIALGTDVLIAGTDAIHRYDPASGALLRTYADASPGIGEFGSEMLIAGGDLLVSGPGEGAVQRFDAASGTRGASITPPRPDPAFGRRLALAGTDLVVGATNAVHVFEAATGAYRLTLADPEPQFEGCFGSEVLTTPSGFVVASNPCFDREYDAQYGIIYVFDPATGALLDTIRNPNGSDRDRFRALLATGSTVLARYEDLDSGVLVGYRPCIDGILAPGEECDDGNLVNGDGCDRSCRVTRCGNGTVTAGELCDDGNTLAGDGCEPDCTWGALACDGRALDDARITLRRLGGRAGDETMVLTATLAGPTFLSAAAHPDISGAELAITDAAGAPTLDLSMQTAAIPPGPPGPPWSACDPRDGWRARNGTITYVNWSGELPPSCAPGSAGGLKRIVLRTKIEKPIRIRITAQGAMLPTPLVPLRATLRFGTRENGQCWSVAFAPGTCSSNASGSSVSCR